VDAARRLPPACVSGELCEAVLKLSAELNIARLLRRDTAMQFVLSFLVGKFIGDAFFGALRRSKALRRTLAVAAVGFYVWLKLF